MKKLDYVLIIAILVMIGAFTIRFSNRLFVDTEGAKLTLTYKNIQLDLIDYDRDVDVVYEMTVTSEDPDTLVFKKTINNNTITQMIPIATTAPFHNLLHVTYERIHMDEASCENKVCQRTFMSPNQTLPIVCTNGIIAEFMSEQRYIDEVLVP